MTVIPGIYEIENDPEREIGDQGGGKERETPEKPEDEQEKIAATAAFGTQSGMIRSKVSSDAAPFSPKPPEYSENSASDGWDSGWYFPWA